MVTTRARWIGGTAVVVVAAIAIWGSGSQGTNEANDLGVLKAVVGDAPPEGACVGFGEFLMLEPDPGELLRLVEREGADGRLSDGGWVARDARTLASRVGGDVVLNNGDQVQILIVKGGERRVDEYMRLASSKGELVWYQTGTQMRIKCSDSGDS
ncbi:MAG: hypothetical protein ACC726_08145 [Chloroflexota bacterium]